MYKIKDLQFTNLNDALEYAKQLNEFVTITSTDSQFEIVGWFGVDSVVEGRLPGGEVYTWKMRRD
jgi:hypothetical protein